MTISTQPQSSAERSRRWRERNPDGPKTYRRERAEYQREYRAANKDRDKSKKLQRQYGITLEERDQMLARQGGVCAICKTDAPTTKLGWVVDHCHDTGRVRGILCSPCNTLLGAARDNVATLSNAIQYLN
jgi:hypothetical protein